MNELQEEFERRRALLRARALIKEEEELIGKQEEAEEDEDSEEESSEEESEESEDETVPRMKPVFVEKYIHFLFFYFFCTPGFYFLIESVIVIC